MQTWTHKKLIDKLLKSNANYCFSGGIDENEFVKAERYTDELMRRLDVSDDERRKIYKNGYDQGKFDGAADSTYGQLSKMKLIATGVAQSEFKGDLPRR